MFSFLSTLLLFSLRIVNLQGTGVVVEENQEKVKIQLYYESHCPGCQEFVTTELLKVYNKLQDYIGLQTYPYGNAETVIHDNGTVEFECQHGLKECYGNMLHACAIDYLGNSSLPFNACMMEDDNKEDSSNDAAADKCASDLDIDVGLIKTCAKGNKGIKLHKYYGEESNKVKFDFIPYVLVNGKTWDADNDPDFIKFVCASFNVPPPVCE